jgi:uncharacterized protein (TIGR02996 family)
VVLFPALQVLAQMAPRVVSVPIGGHISLDGKSALTFGNSASADVPVVSKATAGTHCRLQKLGGHWVLHDVAGVWGTYLNGRRLLATQVLRHQDVVELKGAVVFRYLEHAPRELLFPALEAPLAQDPTDEAAWAVYADWLAEHGSELCEQVTATEPTPEQQARWLGPLARLWLEGELELSWRQGHVVRATLRRLQEYLVPRPEVIVGLMLEAPACRFLQSLEVDLSVQAELRAGARERFALAVVRAATKSWGAVGLKSFTLGPATVWKPPAAVVHAFEALAKKRPSLTTAPSSMVRRMEGAALELAGHPPEVRVEAKVGHRFALPREGVALVAPRNNALVKLLPAKSVQPFAEGFVVQHLRDVWTVAPPGAEMFLLCTQLKVNGQKRRAQCLRHGDLIELWEGLSFRFVEAGR